MQRNITAVPLEQIIPSATNPRKYFNEGKLKELAASLKKTGGVIQAITLRPHPDQKGKYELVFGERRYRASGLAEFKTIDAEIKELTDDQVTEIQFIENIEREDVHPMDEAVTFQAMRTHKTKPWSVADIAAKINKPESYVVQRLQLVSLIPELQKEFWDDKFLIGHAIQFARLTAADQKTCFTSKKNGAYGSVNDAKDFIERNIMQHLSAAPFDKKDAKLFPEAGTCTDCPKRSGCNALLFDDIKQDDRCFDKKCFTVKINAHLVNTVETVILEKPDVFLIKESSTIPPVINNILQKHGIKPLDYYSNEIHTSKYRNSVAIKALVITGNDSGKIKTYYRDVKSKQVAAAGKGSAEKVTAAMIDQQISAINDRLKRGVELDYEKVQDRIIEDLKKRQDKNEVLKKELPHDLATAFCAYFLFREVSWNGDKLRKALALPDSDANPELFFDKLLKLSNTQLHSLIYHNLVSKYSTILGKQRSSFVMRKLAECFDVPIGEFVADQQIIRSKREQNAQKRVEDLLQQKDALKKPAPKPVPTPANSKEKRVAAAKKVAPGAKKVAKKAIKKPAAKKAASKKKAA